MNYDFFNPPVYLDLGGALAAFGLIFAVYQLRKPQWELTLRIREWWQSNLFWIFGGIGLFLVLIRVLLPQEWIRCFSFPLDTLLSYEIAAYLFFIASPVSLLYFSTKSRGLFNKKSARKFYEALVWEISKTTDDNVNAALGVLLPNFEDICKAIRDNSEKEEIHQSASAILDVILSDASVVKILTTKRLNALQYIFTTIEKYNITERDAGIGIPILVRNLFYDRDSFFHKHLDREGLALPLNIYETIFDSPTLLTNFNMFGWRTLEYSRRRDMNMGVFKETLSRSIKTYLTTGNVPPRHINEGLKYLSEISWDVSLKINTEEKRGTDSYARRPEWDTLHDIANFLGHDYVFVGHRDTLNQNVVDREKNTTEADFYSNSTINAGIAGALYKTFEHLASVGEDDFMYWHTLTQLTHGIVYEGSYKEGYREPFLKRIWQQIGANVINRYYPAAVRPYLAFIGFYLPNTDKKTEGWLGEEIERVRRLLYVDMKPLLDANTKMVNDENMKDALLPSFMNYRDGKFTYKYGFGKGEEKEIPPPPEGSTSALEGVDLEHRSLL